MLQTKAIYNLLRLQVLEDPSIQAEAWAIEDLRKVPLEELFSRLQKDQFHFDKQSFIQFANQVENPEELTELLFPDHLQEELRDRFYLTIFEIWRRLLPEKRSLSLFFDELDFQIGLYDQGVSGSEEKIQEALTSLLEILEENVDSGVDPENMFSYLADYCANDIMDFLYDYISDLLDNGNSLYASELIEGFYPFAVDKLWFDFFRVRLSVIAGIGDANAAIHRLLESQPTLPLLLEVLRFLVGLGDKEIFKDSLKQSLLFVKEEEELIELLAIMADYYQLQCEEGLVQTIHRLMNTRKEGPPRSSDFQMIQSIIE
jgi:hypothetical protein